MAAATLSAEQLQTMDRFELIATWLVMVTRRKTGREQVGGMKVARCAQGFRVTFPEVGDGRAALFTGDASGLFEYARRTELNAQIRIVEDARAHALAAQQQETKVPPANGARVKYTGDVANLPYTATVVRTWKDQWGVNMDLLPDVPEGEQAQEKRGVPCHDFPETGPGARWVLAATGERREHHPNFNPDLSNTD